MLGPYIKFRSTRGTEMSANVNKGKQFENQFFIYGPKCKQNVYFGLFGGGGGPEGSSIIRLGLAFQLSSHPYQYTCQIRKQYDKKYLCLNPKYEKRSFVHIWVSLVALPSNPGERENVRSSGST